MSDSFSDSYEVLRYYNTPETNRVPINKYVKEVTISQGDDGESMSGKSLRYTYEGNVCRVTISEEFDGFFFNSKMYESVEREAAIFGVICLRLILSGARWLEVKE